MQDVVEIIKHSFRPLVGLTPEQKAKNALLWISRLRVTQTKQQPEFLGSDRAGYSILGFGCKLLGLETYPDAKYSKPFADAVGLFTETGAFNRALKYQQVYHKSLYHMGREFSFGRIGWFLNRADVIRNTFVPEVAEILLKTLVKKGLRKTDFKVKTL